MQPINPTTVQGPVINRISDLMMHCDWYAIRGVRRLARDAGVSPSTVSRLIHNRLNPSFRLVARVTDAMEKRLGFRIDPRDLVAEDGRFLIQFACEVAGCRGCLPDAAHDNKEQLREEFKSIKPGEWVTSRYPRGFRPERES